LEERREGVAPLVLDICSKASWDEGEWVTVSTPKSRAGGEEAVDRLSIWESTYREDEFKRMEEATGGLYGPWRETDI
jgi:hypothetical protein